MFLYCLVFVFGAICSGAITFAIMPSHRTASTQAGVGTWLVPGASEEVEALVIRKDLMPVLCLSVCPRPAGPHKPVSTRRMRITTQVWFRRFTDSLNQLPQWQEPNGCVFGKGAWLYTVTFHYVDGDRWMVTVDRGSTMEMVFARNGILERGGGSTCISSSTASVLNRLLDAGMGERERSRIAWSSSRQGPGVTAGSACLSPAHPHVAPPAGFLPGRATSRELRCYGFPARPIDSVAQQKWNRLMAHALHYVPPVVATVPGVHFGDGSSTDEQRALPMASVQYSSPTAQRFT